MKKIFFILLAVNMLSCQRDADQGQNAENGKDTKLDIQLTCEDIGSTDDMPAYAVYAIINNAKTKIMEVSVPCESITRDAYAGYEIPIEALFAVGGWWAGGGDYFYATKDGDKRISIYHAAVDETAPGYPYEIIATYENGKFSVQLPK